MDAYGFYKTAKSDIEIAKLLHDNKQFPNAIYHLQQAVEKLSKSFGLITEIIRPSQIKKISHYPKKIFTKHINTHQEKLNQLSKIEEDYPNLLNFQFGDKNLNLNGYHKDFKKSTQPMIHLKEDDFAVIDDSILDKMIGELNKFNTKIEIDYNKYIEEYPDVFKSLIKHIEKETQNDLSELYQLVEDKEQLDIMYDFTLKMGEAHMKISKMYLSLFFLSLLTTSHNQDTRYPCKDCGELPENNYDMGNTLVKRFSDIYQILEDSIKDFKEVFLIRNDIFHNSFKNEFMQEDTLGNRIRSYVQKNYKDIENLKSTEEFLKRFVSQGYINGYEPVNNFMRGTNKIPVNKGTIEYIPLFKEVLLNIKSISSKTQSLYRGLRLEKEDFERIFINKSTFMDAAFLSTTTDWDKAARFVTEDLDELDNPELIMLKIKSYKNAKPIYKINGEMSVDGKEHIFSPNTKFKIVDIKKTDKKMSFKFHERVLIINHYWDITLEEII